jgi:hypothetical protein
MGNLRNPRLIYLKGFLFLVIAIASCGLILYEFWHPKLILLVAIAIWSSARFYYFAFYVIEHYVDPNYKFAGLGSFVAYFLRRPRRTPGTGETAEATDHTERADRS